MRRKHYREHTKFNASGTNFTIDWEKLKRLEMSASVLKKELTGMDRIDRMKEEER